MSDRLIDAGLWRAGCGRKNIAALVNHRLVDAVAIGLLAGLTLAEVADAMRVGWPELGTGGGPGQRGGLSRDIGVVRVAASACRRLVARPGLGRVPNGR